MTENEKAATFIGWTPGQRCSGCDARMMEHGFENIDAETGEPFGRSHIIDAPDMADPRNYMKALEAISAAGYNITLEDRWQLTIDKETPEGQEHFVIFKIDSNQHNVFIVALAALYDAEHGGHI